MKVGTLSSGAQKESLRRSSHIHFLIERENALLPFYEFGGSFSSHSYRQINYLTTFTPIAHRPGIQGTAALVGREVR